MENEKTEQPPHLLSNKVYNALKNVALVVLPAVGAFYFALAGIWGLPAAEQVLGTIVAFDTFLGVVIKLGDVSYNASEARYDGDVVLADGGGGKKIFSLQLNDEPEELEGKDEVIFKVKKAA